MDRQQTLEALKNIAAQLAEEYSLGIMTAKDISLGFWDESSFTGSKTPLSDMIKEELNQTGEVYQDIHFTDVPYEEYDNSKNMQVTLGYWFREPKISVGMLNGPEGYANATFMNKAPEGEPENYEFSASQVYKEKGMMMLNKIMDYWKEEKERVIDKETPNLSIKDISLCGYPNGRDDYAEYEITVNKEFLVFLLRQDFENNNGLTIEEYNKALDECKIDPNKLVLDIYPDGDIQIGYIKYDLSEIGDFNLTKEQEVTMRNAIIDYALIHDLDIKELEEVQDARLEKKALSILEREQKKLDTFHENKEKGLPNETANFYEIQLGSRSDGYITDDEFEKFVNQYLREMHDSHDSDFPHASTLDWDTEYFRSYLDGKICEMYETNWRYKEDMQSALKWSAGIEDAQIVVDYIEKNYDSFEEGISQYLYLTYDTSQLINEYQANIILATSNDMNYDGNVLPKMAGDYYESNIIKELNSRLSKASSEDVEKHFDTALAYLVYQQGHDLTEVLQKLYGTKKSDNEFVQGVAAALNSVPYDYGELIAVINLNANNLDVITQIGKQEGYITLPQGTEMCLYDKLNGSESMTFTLEKDFTFSAEKARCNAKSQVPAVNMVQIYNGQSQKNNYCIYESYTKIRNLKEAHVESNHIPEESQKYADMLRKDLPNVVKSISNIAKEFSKKEQKEL